MAKKFATHVENFYISYSDMVTLLMILFVYLFSISELEPIQFLQASESMRQELTESSTNPVLNPLNIEVDTLKTLKVQIEGLILKFGLGKVVTVEYKNYQLELNLGETILFELGKAYLKPEARVILGEIGNLFKVSDSNIFIEGFTDDLPIHSLEYPSNWELSAARSASVVRFMEGIGLPSARFTVVGHGETQNLVPNTTMENRAQNRRVKITLRPDMQKIQQLEKENKARATAEKQAASEKKRRESKAKKAARL